MVCIFFFFNKFHIGSAVDASICLEILQLLLPLQDFMIVQNLSDFFIIIIFSFITRKECQ